MRIKLAVILTTFSCFVLLCFSCPARASTFLMDGKLEISGFIKETAYIRTGISDREKKYHDKKNR